MGYKGDKGNPFAKSEPPSLHDVDRAIYGGSAPPPSGRVVSTPINLLDIWFDPSQPARRIPSRIRKQWDGDPSGAKDLLKRWQDECQRYLEQGESLYASPILKKDPVNGFIQIDEENARPLVQSFVGLIKLASAIRDDGLLNPVTVRRRAGGGYVLHTGERRLLAYHLLWAVLGDDYAKIPATTVAGNVWSQIAENTQRLDMNAVSMARSLALLIMDMYSEEREFKTYDEMTTAYGCDRPYYAQVVDLQVKQGMGEQVLNALNASHRSYVAKYRNILRLPDEVWMQADEEDWSERRIRDWFDAQKPPKTEKMFPTGNILPQTPPESPRAPETAQGSKTRDYVDETPEGGYKSEIGMKLYGNVGDTRSAPTDDKGQGNAARPVITEFSTTEEWKASGYVHCLHPSEFGPGETWTEEDEALAEMASQAYAGMEAKNNLGNVPISIETGMGKVLEKLYQVAAADDGPGSGRVAGVLRNLMLRGREDIRAGYHECSHDLNTYAAQLHTEYEVVAEFLERLTQRVGEHMERLAQIAEEIAGMSDG